MNSQQMRKEKITTLKRSRAGYASAITRKLHTLENPMLDDTEFEQVATSIEGIHSSFATTHDELMLNLAYDWEEAEKARELYHSTKKPVTTMLIYPWKCTVLHCNHLGNTWKPLVLMTRHFDYCPSASKGDNQSVRSSAPVVFRCFPGGHNVKLYISRGRLAWWLLAFLHSVS